jgi:uncharacterized protein (TIGR00369 family)
MRDWIEASAFGRALGVRLLEETDTSARLSLPFQEANANPGGALHGGCAGSLGLIGGRVVARMALGEAKAPFHTAACQVSYLAAAIGEDVVATTRLTRKGKALCFTETSVHTPDDKLIAQISTVVRGRDDAPSPALPPARGDDGAADPGPMGPFVGSMPFSQARQLTVEHMADGQSRLVMPVGDANADLDGTFHEGAILAMLDTTGAMGAWAVVGPGPFQASSAVVQAQILDVARVAELVAYGHVVHRDGDLFWVDVEITDMALGRLYARGTVMYRIVT